MADAMISRPQDVALPGPIDEAAVQAFVAKVGTQVRRARQQKAMSRRVLSELSGVSERYLAQLETGTGNISVGLLFKVAAAMGLRPDALLADDGMQETGKAKRICLIGLRGAGKSSLGRLVTKELSIGFCELNHVIEEQSGIPVSEVMALYGQEGYRRLERQAAEAISREKEAVVLAAGGGIVSEAETFNYVLRCFHTVWIKASPEEHMERVRQQGDDRPMAGNPKAMDELKSILTSREALYSRADAMVDTSGRTLDESGAELLGVVRGFGFG